VHIIVGIAGLLLMLQFWLADIGRMHGPVSAVASLVLQLRGRSPVSRSATTATTNRSRCSTL
jgi:hypothetical protein